MKRWLIIGAVAILCAAGAVAAWMIFSAPAEPEAPRTVAVTRGDVEETVLAFGVIEASSLVSVGAEVSGSIKTLNVDLGDDVQAGDVIAEIDSLDQENAVKSAEASLANIEAQKEMQEATLAQARVSLERAEKLSPNKLISDADYQSAQLAVQTAEGELKSIEAQIQQAQLNVESAQLDLDRTRIVAPSDGTVVAVAVEVGQSVNATNSTPTIVKIANLDLMVVKAEISEADVPRVLPGQRVYFTILGDPDTEIEATLRTVEPAPSSIEDDSSSSSSSDAVYYNGLFDVENPDHRLRISMTAQVTIVLAEVTDALVVPSSVLTTKAPSGDYIVLVYDPTTETSRPQPIKIGLDNGVDAEVRSGLEEGDQVVSATAGSTPSTLPSNGGLLSGRPQMMVGGGGPPPM